MEGESTLPPPPHPVIIFLLFACLAYVDYPKLWRCFVFLHHRIHTNQFMWKRNILFFSIWMSVIPVLLGRLIDLMIIIPNQVRLHKTPVYSSLLQEWLTGLVVLLTWSYQIVFTKIDCFQTTAWQRKIQRIKREGIDQLPLNWLFGSVIGSAIQTLLASLIVPYVVSLFLGAFCGATYAVQRLVWPAFFVFIVLCFICRAFVRQINHVWEVEYRRLYHKGYVLMDYDDSVHTSVTETAEASARDAY